MTRINRKTPSGRCVRKPSAGSASSWLWPTVPAAGWASVSTVTTCRVTASPLPWISPSRPPQSIRDLPACPDRRIPGPLPPCRTIRRLWTYLRTPLPHWPARRLMARCRLSGKRAWRRLCSSRGRCAAARKCWWLAIPTACWARTPRPPCLPPCTATWVSSRATALEATAPRTSRIFHHTTPGWRLLPRPCGRGEARRCQPASTASYSAPGP